MAGDLANFTRDDLANWVGGHRIPSANGKTYGVTAPVSNAVYRRASASLGADVNRAVNLALAELDGPWAAMAAADRARVLNRVADGIEARADGIADTESLDTGLPVTQATDLVARAASCFRSCADAITAPGPDGAPALAPPDGSGPHRAFRAPGGIAGLVATWQAPLLSAARQLAAALAAGCLVILMTDEWTPLSSSELPEILTEAGVPEGTVSLLHGRRGDDGVPALLSHPGVPLVSFAGDASAAREAIRSAAPFKRVMAESTSATPCVIFGDADPDRAAEGALSGAFALNGTAPGAGTRILVEESAYEDVVARLASGAAQLRVGPPPGPETDIGPVTHEDLYDRLVKQIRVAVREDARLVAGGSRPGSLPEGNYLAPTVLADVTMSMTIFTAGTPGPVACVSSFASADEAVAAANVLSGRAASVWTADLDRAERMAGPLKADDIWVNSVPEAAPAADSIGFFTRSRTLHVAELS